MRRETQERFEQWRISLPDGSWKRIEPPDPYNARGGKHEVTQYRQRARGLGIDYEPRVEKRIVRRVTVVTSTTIDTPEQWQEVPS